jgi:[ribosomal protein S5]-alanine N-acetyltransferase
MIEGMKAPEIIQTSRLTLRKPMAADAEAIFLRYAGDPVVTRYLSWPTHQSVEDTQVFLAWSDADWELWPAGSYLVLSRDEGRLLGGTGLSFTSSTCAVTGYVFARDAWGKGYATESLQAMVDLARTLGVQRLEAICHVAHGPSARVLEKCCFRQEAIRREFCVFPNLAAHTKSDVFSYVYSW